MRGCMLDIMGLGPSKWVGSIYVGHCFLNLDGFLPRPGHWCRSLMSLYWWGLMFFEALFTFIKSV